MTTPRIDVDFNDIRMGDVIRVRDRALNGDEDLHVSKQVELTDGELTLPAIITRRDAGGGGWFAQLCLDP